AHTVYCYQQRKFVMTEPSVIPRRGYLWLEPSPREEVLRQWQALVDQENLQIRYHQQVTEVRKEEGSFVVKTDTDVFTAQYVVMAVGTQGTQRTLGVPGEDLSHVWPRLDDAEKYTNNDDIVVIGGGDAGIEVATDLVSNNRVRLVVRTPEFVRANSSLKYE